MACMLAPELRKKRSINCTSSHFTARRPCPLQKIHTHNTHSPLRPTPAPAAAALRRRAGGGAHLLRRLPHQDAAGGLHRALLDAGPGCAAAGRPRLREAHPAGRAGPGGLADGQDQGGASSLGTTPARRFSATAGPPGWLAGTLRRLLRAAPHLCPPLSCPLPTPVPCLPVSQVFLRAGKMAELDKRKMEVQHAAATAIQTAVRGYLARKHFARARAAAITIQAAARGMAARSEARHLRRTRAATVIQAAARRWAARRAFTAAVRAAVAVQAAWRGWKARLYTRDIRQHRAALAIQTHWRRHRAQAEFQRYRKGVVTAQVRRRACGAGSFVLCRRVNTACSSRSPVLLGLCSRCASAAWCSFSFSSCAALPTVPIRPCNPCPCSALAEPVAWQAGTARASAAAPGGARGGQAAAGQAGPGEQAARGAERAGDGAGAAQRAQAAVPGGW